MNPERGIFVAIDGPKHAGKTAVLAEAHSMLQRMGASVLVTKEPTGSFKLNQEESHTGMALARLLVADRAHHVETVILPGLRTHDVVITDRYISSMLVFQAIDGLA